jgi:hypothetical protein
MSIAESTSTGTAAAATAPWSASRTLGDIVNGSYSKINLKPLRADPLPGDGLPKVKIPT